MLLLTLKLAILWHVLSHLSTGKCVQVSNINILTSTAKRNTTHKLRSMDYDFRLASPAPAASSKVGAPTPSSGPPSPWCPRQLCSRQPGSPGQGFN